jgi:hypothetical protein
MLTYRSSSQTPQQSHSYQPPASTSSQSSCPNAASRTAKTHTQSSTSHSSAHWRTQSRNSVRHALIECGSWTRLHRPQAYHQVQALHITSLRSACKARMPCPLRCPFAQDLPAKRWQHPAHRRSRSASTQASPASRLVNSPEQA